MCQHVIELLQHSGPNLKLMIGRNSPTKQNTVGFPTVPMHVPRVKNEPDDLKTLSRELKQQVQPFNFFVYIYIMVLYLQLYSF